MSREKVEYSFDATTSAEELNRLYAVITFRYEMMGYICIWFYETEKFNDIFDGYICFFN